MSRRTKPWYLVVIGLLALLVLSRLPVSGQDTRSKDDVLQALLLEVRGLRIAIEQMTAAGPRVQLAMGRLQIQEQRLAAARRRLEDVRESIGTAERESAEARDRMTVMEEAAQRVIEAPEREALAAQLKMSKTMLAQKAADLQRLRDREVEMAGLVATEESRWTEISQSLDEIERALSPRR